MFLKTCVANSLCAFVGDPVTQLTRFGAQGGRKRNLSGTRLVDPTQITVAGSAVRTGQALSALRGACREQPPFVRDPFELLRAAVNERNPRSGDEILDRAGDQHLPWAGQGSDPSSDVDRDPPDVLVHDLDLPAVEPDANLQADGAGTLRDCAAALNCPRGAVEG